jgi:hypothetical protein
LRQQFWDTFDGEVGEISDLDRRSMEVARLMGLLRTHGNEWKNAMSGVYLEKLLLLPSMAHGQPFSVRAWFSVICKDSVNSNRARATHIHPTSRYSLFISTQTTIVNTSVNG